ncbi:MAG: hypothetical protein ABIP54_03595 [Candidatus Andersenbacteria bacterium]
MNIIITRWHRSEDRIGLFAEIACDNERVEAFFLHLITKRQLDLIILQIEKLCSQGMPFKEAVTSVARMPMPEQSLRTIDGIHGSKIFAEHTQDIDHIIESIQVCTMFAGSNKKICVLQELPNALGTVHNYAHLGEQIAQYADMVICIGRAMREVQEAVLKTNRSVDTHSFDTPEQAITWLRPHIKKDDMIYTNTDLAREMDKIE